MKWLFFFFTKVVILKFQILYHFAYVLTVSAAQLFVYATVFMQILIFWEYHDNITFTIEVIKNIFSNIWKAIMISLWQISLYAESS